MTASLHQGEVYFHDKRVGLIELKEDLYLFTYDLDYLAQPDSTSISVTFPLQKGSFSNKVLFPFFDGLISEGWLLNLTVEILKLNPMDRMGLLLSCCHDCIGAVSVQAVDIGESRE